MICFSDTDIFLKLIAFGLMEKALAALGVTSTKDVYVTPEAASKCRRSKRSRTTFRQEILNKAEEFLRKCKEISEAGDQEEAELLLDIEDDMDVGESTLFLATKDKTDFILLTGDKRALYALTDNFLSHELHNRHLQRVVCLESLILLIIKREGFAAVYDNLRREPLCDGAIQKALRGGLATEAEFIETLERYVQRLDEETQGLLMKF